MDMLHVASAVNPCFKALPFLSEEEWDSTFSRLQTEAVSGMEEEASNVSNNKKPCGKIQANPTLFSLTHSLTHLCIQYKFSLSSLSHSKMMLMMKLMEWRKRWNPNPLHLTPSNPVPWSLSLGKLTDQERKEEHRKLDQRQKTRSKGTGQGDLRSCGMKSSILFWLSWQSDICVPWTSVASERVFSTAGDIITAKRSCLTPGHVNELLFLQKNLKIP